MCPVWVLLPWYKWPFDLWVLQKFCSLFFSTKLSLGSEFPPSSLPTKVFTHLTLGHSCISRPSTFYLHQELPLGCPTLYSTLYSEMYNMWRFQSTVWDNLIAVVGVRFLTFSFAAAVRLPYQLPSESLSPWITVCWDLASAKIWD